MKINMENVVLVDYDSDDRDIFANKLRGGKLDKLSMSLSKISNFI